MPVTSFLYLIEQERTFTTTIGGKHFSNPAANQLNVQALKLRERKASICRTAGA